FGTTGQKWTAAIRLDDLNRTDGCAHPPTSDHLARELCQLLDVRLGTGRRFGEDDLLRGTAAERDLDLREELPSLIVEAVGVRSRERHSEREAARDDRDFPYRVCALAEHADDRVAGLVVRRAAPILRTHHHLPLRTQHNALQRVA